MSFEQFTYLTNQLKQQFGFDDDHAQDAANRLILDNRVYEGVVQFLTTGKLTGLNIAGHSVESLVNDYKLEPIGAYLMLAQFAVDPQKGEEYLARIREEGHHVPKYDKNGNLIEIVHRTVNVKDQAPTCPKCGKKATWVDQYKRWYCYDCKDYL